MSTRIDSSWYRRPPEVPSHEAAGGIVARWHDGEAQIALISETPNVVYVLPKGHLEAGERPEQTARREIEEEAGLKNLRLQEALGVRERLNFEKTAWKRTHYFLFVVEARASVPGADREFETRWFSLDRLPELFWPEQRQMVMDYRERIREAVRPPGAA